jgi:hypothetical protein
MSPDQSEGVFDARGVGGRSSEGMGRALIFAGPMTERRNGLVPEQSGGTMPTDGFGVGRYRQDE